MRTPTILLIAILFVTVPASASPTFSRSGAFFVGDAVSATTVDACGNRGFSSDWDSACFDLDLDYAGVPFLVTATDETGLAASTVVACFYAVDGSFLGCPEVNLVPDEAVSVGVSALAGLGVRWSLVIDADLALVPTNGGAEKIALPGALPVSLPHPTQIVVPLPAGTPIVGGRACVTIPPPPTPPNC